MGTRLDPKMRTWRTSFTTGITDKERLIVFLGAGASFDARGGASGDDAFPTAGPLRDKLWQNFMPDRGGAGRTLTLEHATALIESRAGRRPLVETVARMYTTRKPIWSHLVLPLLGPRAVFTTNYDRLIELGWEACAAQGHVSRTLIPIFADEQRFNTPDVPLFKPHGSVDRAHDPVGKGGLVITMFDYFKMLEAKRQLLRHWLKHVEATCAIFIGYSLMDMDIASYLFDLRQKDHDLHWYAVFPRDDVDVRNMYSTQFHIRPIARTLCDFLVELDAAVDFLPDALKQGKIPDLQARSLIQ